MKYSKKRWAKLFFATAFIMISPPLSAQDTSGSTQDTSEAAQEAPEQNTGSVSTENRQAEETPKVDDAGQEVAEQKSEEAPEPENSEANTEAEKTEVASEPEVNEPTPEPKKAEVVPEPKRDFTIASWGGAYMQAQSNAYITPYKESSDLEVALTKHSGNYKAIKARLSSNDNSWDVVDLSYNMVNRACEEGLLETINADTLEGTPDGSPANGDFIAGGLHKCGVASMAWSSIVVFNKKSFKRRRTPATAKDLFNIRRYRGKRTLPASPENVLELALLADGVKPEDIYKTLESTEGVNRAFKKLTPLRKHIIWWSDPAEPFNLLASGKASMGVAYSGRAFSQIAEQKKNLGIIWNGQIYDLNFWAIPKTSAYKRDAQHFLTYATSPKRLAMQASWFPYGPARLSSIKLIKPHPEAGIDMKPYVPTMPANLKLALQKNKSWWTQNGAIIQARFERWRRNEPEPKLSPLAIPETEQSMASDKPEIEPEPEQEEAETQAN